MRVTDLQHDELLQLDPDGGLIHFAGQRAILIDAVAMGLLRKYLIGSFGLQAARAVLTQFGFAHGWRRAAAMGTEFEWDTDDDWRLAGPRIHCLEGLFRTQSVTEDPLGESGATLLGSYEAEQHLLHFGRSEGCVCWTISGLISGYLSQTAEEEIFALEDRCVGRGDPACRMRGQSREAWGADRAEDLAFFDAERLEDYLDSAIEPMPESRRQAEGNARSRQTEPVRGESESSLSVMAKSEAMRRTVDLARRAAAVDVTVLISGESGVGKERVARLIHSASPRANGPFIAVNCGAITETLLESELFGHKRGAFTGAESDRPGLFEAADGGTLLLDEIGEVSQAMQVKLLRVLQEREVRRVGENRERPVDVRVLAATNRPLADDIADGSFREDLYYRLKVVELDVPALRDRTDDILPLARLLLVNAANRMAREITTFSSAVADQLLRYHWPGNVRELENAMERAAALATGSRVEIEDLPEELRGPLRKPIPSESDVVPLAGVEREYIESVLALNDGNRAATAKQLGIGSATLYRKLKAWGESDD